MTSAPVPLMYQGLWRRTLLETLDGRDLDSLVYWLQTERWHADIRIPTGRPNFGGVNSLEQCAAAQLAWLLQQEGFAGVTVVEGDLCEWHRRMDYRCDSHRDIGHLRFSGGLLEEFGVERPYYERWQAEHGILQIFQAQCSSSHGVKRLLLRAGEFFIHMRPRTMSAEDCRQLWAKVADQSATLAEMRMLADFEISFGKSRDGAMYILKSTLPWLEGSAVPELGVWSNLTGEDDE